MKTPRNGNTSKERSAPIALGAVIVVAAALRFVHLGAKSVWSDEAFSIFLARQNWSNFWHMVSTAEANMSLYYLLLRGWLQVGDGAWWVRFLSALLSVAAVPIVFSTGKAILSQRAGIIAALLLAVNPFDIRYAQEARSYSLFVLLVSLSFLAFFLGMQRPGRVWSAVYILSTALALYAHFFAAFAVLVQLVSVLMIPNEQRRLVVRYAVQLGIVVILGLPLLWFVAFRDRGQLSWAPPVNWRDLYDVFRFMVGSGVKLVIALAAFFVVAAAWVGRWRRERWTLENWSVLVLMLWLFLPVFLTLLVSVWKPMYAPRFLIFCLPAALLLVGDGLAEIRYTWVGYVLLLALVIGEAGPIRSYYAEPGEEDWRAAVAFLAAEAHAGETVVLPNPYCGLPLTYQLEHARVAVPQLRIISPPTPESLRASGPDHLWAITCAATKDRNAQFPIGEYRVQAEKRFKGVKITRRER